MKYKLENYVLNKEKTLKELMLYGIIDGGGNYSIKYAYGNFINFSPNNYKFRRIGRFYADRDINYQKLLEDKIEYLISNEIIVESKGGNDE